MNEAVSHTPLATLERWEMAPHPAWLWDPKNRRIVWANRAALDFMGIREILALKPLRFNPATPWVMRLARLAKTNLPPEGQREFISFSQNGERPPLACLCFHHPLPNGETGILVLAKEENPDETVKTPLAQGNRELSLPQPDEKDRQTLKEIARLIQEGDAERQGTSVAVSPFDLPRETGQTDSPTPPPTERPPRPNGPDSLPTSSGGISPPLITPSTVEEVAARSAHSPPSDSLHGYTGKTNKKKPPTEFAEPTAHTPLPREVEPTQSQIPRGAGKEATKEETPNTSLPEKLPETVAEWFEALPAGVAIVREESLIFTNRAFLYAFGYGSVKELEAAGGLARLFPKAKDLFSYSSPDETQRLSVRHVTLSALSQSGRRVPVALSLKSQQKDGAVWHYVVLHPPPAPTKGKKRHPKQLRTETEGAPTSPPWSHEETAPAKTEPGTEKVRTKDKDQEGEAKSMGSPGSNLDSKRALDRVALLARISHDVRTPLNAIVGFAEIMRDERFGPVNNPRYVGYLEDILHSARHALSLVNDLLDLSRIRAGELHLTPVPTDVNGVARRVLKRAQPLATEQRIVLRSALQHDLPALHTDPRALERILDNLLSNAVKYTKAGGQVVFSTSWDPETGIRLRIRDTGPGMTAEDIATALQPFRQLSSETRPPLPGSGLGLPLAKALSEAAGANFAISSTLGKGTLVEVTFPPGMSLSPHDENEAASEGSDGHEE